MSRREGDCLSFADNTAETYMLLLMGAIFTHTQSLKYLQCSNLLCGGKDENALCSMLTYYRKYREHKLSLFALVINVSPLLNTNTHCWLVGVQGENKDVAPPTS